MKPDETRFLLPGYPNRSRIDYLRERIVILREVLNDAAARGVRDTETLDDLMDAQEELHALNEPFPIHRTQATHGMTCSTCDSGGCPDCTDPA